MRESEFSSDDEDLRQINKDSDETIGQIITNRKLRGNNFDANYTPDDPQFSTIYNPKHPG